MAHVFARFVTALRALFEERPIAAPAATNSQLNPLPAESPERVCSQLFSASYYLEQHPDVARVGIDPLHHFVHFGAKEGRDPHPLFSCTHYRSQIDTDNPLLHYLTDGKLDPHPLFSTRYYTSAVETNGENPLCHFLKHGRRSPSPLFDLPYYLAQIKGDTPPNALVHYLQIGVKQGLRPNPLFDPKHYRESLQHYATSGKGDPHPLFHGSHYSEDCGNALAHYLSEGHRRGLPCNASRIVPTEMAVSQLLGRLYEPGPARLGIAAEPKVSIVIAVYNQLHHTLRCLRALAALPDQTPFEVIVVDDASSDDTEKTLRDMPGIMYLRAEKNRGFLHSANDGAARATGDIVWLLNNDTLPLPGAIDALVETFRQYPNAGLVGSALLCSDGLLQESGSIIWSDASGWHYGRGTSADRPEVSYVRDVDYCSGASIAVPRRIWVELGGFDAHFAPAYYEDTDFAFRVRASGRRVLVQPRSQVIHVENASYGSSVSSNEARNRPRFLERWQETIKDHGTAHVRPKRFAFRRTRKAVLMIDECVPSPDKDSGSLDAFNILRILRGWDYHVVFIPRSNLLHAGEYTAALQALGVEVLYYPFLTSPKDYIRLHGQDFDFVWLSRAEVAASFIDDVRAFAPQAQVIFDTVDLHYLRMRRAAALDGDLALRDQAEYMRATEQGAMKRADVTLVRSTHEQRVLESDRLRSTVLPIMREAVGRTNSFEQRANIGFMGGFGHPPNADAVRYFLTAIWPQVRLQLPDCKLILAGSHMPADILAQDSSNVVVRGFVPDAREFFESIRLSVAPLRYGAGLKGKVIMSLALGVPCVCSEIAAEGMDAGANDGLVVAEQASEWANELARLYRSEARWTQMSERGVALVRSRFSLANAEHVLREVFAQ